LVSQDEEQTLVNNARDVFIHFRDRLNATDPTDMAQVNQAYALAPFFNVLAALVDNIGQTALKDGRVPMDWTWIEDKRADTLAVNYALVGAQSLWYACPYPGTTSLVDTVQSPSNAFVTKKLWGYFANNPVSESICSDTYSCNVFTRAVTGGEICSRTSCEFDNLLCHACGGTGDFYYDQLLPGILTKMNRDPNVAAVRAGTEKLVELASEHGSGLMMRRSWGALDVWNVWSDTSYRPNNLGSASTVWQPMGTGDFDGDGNADIFWMDATDGDLSIWTLNATGVTSMTPATHNAPNFGSPTRVLTGDLDGDGITDVVFTTTQVDPVSNEPQYISYAWTMTPASTVPSSATYTTSETERVEAVGDFDGDGLADVLYREPATGVLSIQVSGGARVSLPSVGTEWTVNGVGDFNGDHVADIVWQHVSGLVSIWEMQGDRLVNNPLPGYVVGGSAIEGVGDVDHDGTSDIVIRDPSGGTEVWFMNADGSIRDARSAFAGEPGTTFAGVISLGPPTPANTPAPQIQESFCGLSAGTLMNPGFAPSQTMFGSLFDGGFGTFTADVTGDGKADLVGFGSGYTGVLRSTGGVAGYEQWSSVTAHQLPDHTSGLTILGDVTGDGMADVVALGPQHVYIMRSNGSSFGGFEQWSNLSFTGTVGPEDLIGDVDGDGDADLVALFDNTVEINRSSRSGFSGPEDWYDHAFFAQPGGATLLGDVTGDGMADLVAVINGSIQVLRSSGAGFGTPETWASTSFFGATHGIQLADVNGDGMSDVVAFDDTNVRVMRSTGNGFSNPEVWYSNPAFGSHGTFLGDVDGNGKADLIVAGDTSVNMFLSQ
jgi:hypothetical protein